MLDLGWPSRTKLNLKRLLPVSHYAPVRMAVYYQPADDFTVVTLQHIVVKIVPLQHIVVKIDLFGTL